MVDAASTGSSSVPVQPAATVMVLDDRPDLHVLMVRRAARLAFAADSWVFPGGRVDPEDQPADIAALCFGLDDREASAILDLDKGGLAWWVAACRETFEETGILLARPGPGSNGQSTGESSDGESSDGESGSGQAPGDYVELLRRRGLVIDVDTIQEVARFITPPGPPRRYDARFFVTSHDGQQQETVRDDNGEVTDCRWFRPTEALAQWRAGSLQMMSPTVRMVACLERYATTAEVVDHARRRPPYQRVRVEDPQGEYRVLLPGEPGYEDADLEVESGWVRL